MTFHDVHQFNELHAETQIRFVAAIIFHGISPRHTLEWFGQFNTPKSLEQMFGHSFESRNDVFLFYETHFTVNLCKFRLTVGTQVFVTETFCNLEITVEPGNHQ